MQKGASANFCRHPAAESYMRLNGCKAGRSLMHMNFGSSQGPNTQLGRVREGWDGSIGLSSTAVLPAAHRPREERISYPPAALRFACTVSKYLGKQWIRHRAACPFQGEFGSCSVLQLILPGISSLITIFHVTVTGRFHYGPFIIHTQQRGFELYFSQ